MNTFLWVLIGIAALIGIIAIFVPIGLLLSAWFSGVWVSIPKFIGMRLRRVDPEIMVNSLIKAKKADLDGIKFNRLEAHVLAKGRIDKVVDALISAKNADINLDFELATAIDLAGRDILEAVKDSVNTKVIQSPPVEAVAKDGIQLIAVATITVRANLEKLIGGAKEETIMARVGQGIVAAIGSAEKHTDILANPSIIVEKILEEGFIAGTAYNVLSVDIADIDVGQNIGAKLDAEKAESHLKVVQAQAEEKRAEAVAEEQYWKAREREMQAKLIESQSEVPKAISEAFKDGNLGILDYYKLQNLEADTKMRNSFSEGEVPPDSSTGAEGNNTET